MLIYDKIDQKVWEEELSEYLPEQIYDVHCHAWREEDCLHLVDGDASAPSTTEFYHLESLRSEHDEMFPGKQVKGLVFGAGTQETDLEAMNNWLASEAENYGYDSLLYCHPTWDEYTIEKQLMNVHLGFKPYWRLAGENVDDVDLTEMISPAMLSVANKYELIIMTHIPRKGRLADRRNIKGLHQICAAAPKARFILAHLGRSYCPELKKHFAEIADIPNLWADCSMVQDWEVIAYFLRFFPYQRLLFGLDMPIAHEKGKLVCVNGQRHFFTVKPYRWSIHTEPGAYEVRCTLYAYEIIRALLKGATEAGLGRDEIKALFWDNAYNLVTPLKEKLVDQRKDISTTPSDGAIRHLVP